jgi:putative ABC transport system permease protein
MITSVPILRGRTFDAREIQDTAELSLVLSSDLARQFWPNDDPVGRQVQLGNKRILRIVGIVGNVRNLSLGIQPRPTMYFSTRQLVWSPMAVIVRSASDIAVAPTIRKAVAAIDPQLAVFSVRTMEAMLDADAAQPRLTAWLVGLFAALALLLAAIGVYGVLAYLVAQRRQEIGVRMALGAQPGAVVQLVLGHALRLAAAGVALGVVAALILGPYLASQLFGVNPRDTATLTGVAAALIAVAVIASYLPARRATRVDPLIALRAE